VKRESMQCLFLFESVHQVMRAEKLLKEKGMEVDLLPVPREVSSDCGVAIEMALVLKEEAMRLFEENKISIVECYTRDRGRRLTKMR
jgi:electron transfer flavoprotein alpha/beta subunit